MADGVPNDVEWRQLEVEPWAPFPLLGDGFMAKFTATGDGYSLLVTDCSRAWAEHRTADYVREKAEEWASCVEAEVQQMGQLVLQELATASPKGDGASESRSGVRISWEGSGLVLNMKTFLEGLPYAWTFKLSLLQQDMLSRLVTAPLAVQLHALSAALEQRGQEVGRLRQKLADLTPDSARQHQLQSQGSRVTVLHDAATRVHHCGAAAVLCHHLSSDVYQAIRERGERGPVSPSKGGQGGTGRPTRPRKAAAIAPRPHPATKLHEELLSEDLQQERRALIQALTQSEQPAPATSQVTPDPLAAEHGQNINKAVKRKKKLNI